MATAKISDALDRAEVAPTWAIGAATPAGNRPGSFFSNHVLTIHSPTYTIQKMGKKAMTAAEAGRLGGLARAKKLSKKRQSEIGRAAVKKRWEQRTRRKEVAHG